MRIKEFRIARRQEAMQREVNPRDVDDFLSDVLSRPHSWLLAHDEEEIPDHSLQRVETLVQRRFNGEPAQYVRGVADFYGREFLVDSRVLIPRPETEILVEEVLRRSMKGDRILDVGTGSGCIAITTSLEADRHLFACDLSLGALDVASRNAARLGARVRFFSSDLLTSIHGVFDVIVSNPPYIAAEEIAGLQSEVRLHEPHMALTPGESGLEIIERLFLEARAIVAIGGFMLFEIGFGQGEAIAPIAERYGWEVLEIRKDLAAIPRVVVSSRRA